MIPALADRFHVVSPDYPGFGNSDTPDPATFPYTFDKLAEIVEDFLQAKGFGKFGLYVQDYGGPVGFRIVTKKPEVLEWLIGAAGLLELDTVKAAYLSGSIIPALISPDNWNVDYLHTLQRPQGRKLQLTCSTTTGTM